MSKKKHKNKRRPAEGARQPGGVSGPIRDTLRACVAEAVEQGRFKTAVETAKELFALDPSPENEKVLLDAYYARIANMYEKRMLTEARSLAELVTRRWPAAKARFEKLALSGATQAGDLNVVLRVLADPAATDEQRMECERTLREEVTDLAAIAGADALPEDHPLRRQARVLADAFSAVCAGPVDAEAVALNEIPRRSPLAPWKLLIRAIYEFYRNDDDACRKYLEALDPDSASGRAGWMLRRMIDGGWQDLPPGARRSLAGAVAGSTEKLRGLLEAVDNAMEEEEESFTGKMNRLVLGIRKLRPDLLPKFARYLGAHLTVMGAYLPEILRELVGCVPLINASFWRLTAALYRRMDDIEMACAAFEEFRLHAVNEKLFAPSSVEESVLYAHMAQLLTGGDITRQEREDFAAQIRKTFTGFNRHYWAQAQELKDAIDALRDKDPYYWLNPDELYARACQADPSPALFRTWWNWASQEKAKMGARVIQAWSAALPLDPEPLLLAADDAELRGAHVKALGFIEKAEKLDPANKKVRQAQKRLLTLRIKKQLQTKALGKAAKAIEELAALPGMADPDGAAAITLLRSALSMLEERATDAQTHAAQLGALLGNETAAALLVQAMANPLRVHAKPLPALLAKSEVSPEATARAAKIAEDLLLYLPIGVPFEQPLLDALETPGLRVPPANLMALTHNQMEDNPKLASVAAGAGLRIGGPTQAEFLLLRAEALCGFSHGSSYSRVDDCYRAALTLGRRERNTEVVKRAAELLGLGRTFGWHVERQMQDLPDKELERILTREREWRATTRKQPRRLEKRIASPVHTFDLSMGYVFRDILKIVPGPHGKMPPPEMVERYDPELAKRYRKAIKDFEDNHYRRPELPDFMLALDSIPRE